MTIARRVQQLERAEDQRLAAAIADFGASWQRHMADPATTARRDAGLAAAGYRGTTIDEFRAWLGTVQTPAERARSRAFAAAVVALTAHPADHAALRGALGDLTPHLGLAAPAAPVLIIRTLQATIEADPR